MWSQNEALASVYYRCRKKNRFLGRPVLAPTKKVFYKEALRRDWSGHVRFVLPGIDWHPEG